MTSTRTGSGTAVLAGSLAAFPLLDVLELLSRTKHAGEVHVVADGVDTQLRVDGGELLTDDAAAAAERVFELACHHDAWFTVTSTPAAEPGADVQRIGIGPLTEAVAPRLREWGALVRTIPHGSTVHMAPTTPGPEVQIRADQWVVLSGIGSGRTVRELLDATPGPAIDALRVIQQLLDERLVVLEAKDAPGPGAAAPGPERGPDAAAIALPGPARPAGGFPAAARPAGTPGPGGATPAPQGFPAGGAGPSAGGPGPSAGGAGPSASASGSLTTDGAPAVANDSPGRTGTGPASASAASAPGTSASEPPGAGTPDAPAPEEDPLARAPFMPPPVSAGPWADGLAAPPVGRRASDQSA